MFSDILKNAIGRVS